MSKLSLLHSALRSKSTLCTIREKHGGLPLLLPQSLRRFSTEAEQPPPPPDSAAEPFLETPGSALVYAKLLGITRHTLKTDIVNLLEGCNLTLDDVKVDYNRSFIPMAMMVQFRSRRAFDNAFKLIARKGRLYRLDRVDRSQWDLLSPYNGKTVLLQGMSRSVVPEDVERFLSGCDYDSSSINLFNRPAFPDPIKMATVRFNSPTQAMHAFLTKNRGFCLNNQVLMKVLQ